MFTRHYTKTEVFHQGFHRKCDQIHRKLQIWSHLLKKFLMKNFIFGAVKCQMVDVWEVVFNSFMTEVPII